MKFGDIVLCAGTVPGASFEEMVEAAAASGCAGVSVRPGAMVEAIERRGSRRAVARLLRDAQVAIADFDAIVDWIDGDAGRLPPGFPAAALIPQADILELADAFGARAVNVVHIGGGAPSLEELAESFARSCDRAASLGLIVHVEFFEGSAVKDLATAAEIVERAGRANGGVLLDTFHYHRGPSRAESQLAANLGRIVSLQVNDAGAEPWTDRWRERQAGRLLPGEGVIDLVGLLTAVRDAGLQAPCCLEVNNADLHALSPTEAAQRAADSMRSVLSGLPVRSPR